MVHAVVNARGRRGDLVVDYTHATGTGSHDPGEIDTRRSRRPSAFLFKPVTHVDLARARVSAWSLAGLRRDRDGAEHKGSRRCASCFQVIRSLSHPADGNRRLFADRGIGVSNNRPQHS